MTQLEWLQDLLHDPPATDDCIEWPFKLTVKGQAVVKIDGYSTTASRYILGLERGDPLVARHTCDEPCCVNPRHLIVGTPADNSHDMTERGRHRTTGGPLSLRYTRPSERP